MAEKSGAHAGASDVRRVVDPLDGTTNFVHGRGDFAVSVAAERQGTVVTGAVYRPAADEWVAGGDNEIRGSGPPLTGNPPPTPKKLAEQADHGCGDEYLQCSRALGREGRAERDDGVVQRTAPGVADPRAGSLTWSPQRLGREPVGRPAPLRQLASDRG